MRTGMDTRVAREAAIIRWMLAVNLVLNIIVLVVMP
jgi:hypothetical protein